MYLKQKGKGSDTIRVFDEVHGKALLKDYNTWEKPSKSEVKTFEKINNVVNARANKGDITDSDEQQADDK